MKLRMRRWIMVRIVIEHLWVWHGTAFRRSLVEFGNLVV